MSEMQPTQLINWYFDDERAETKTHRLKNLMKQFHEKEMEEARNRMIFSPCNMNLVKNYIRLAKLAKIREESESE